MQRMGIFPSIFKFRLCLNEFRLVLSEFAVICQKNSSILGLPLGKWAPQAKNYIHLAPDFGLGSPNGWRCSYHHASAPPSLFLLSTLLLRQGWPRRTKRQTYNGPAKMCR